MPVKTAPATFEAPAKTALRTMLSAAWWFTAVTLRERKLARARAQLRAAHVGEDGAAVRAAPQAVVAGSAGWGGAGPRGPPGPPPATPPPTPPPPRAPPPPAQ